MKKTVLKMVEKQEAVAHEDAILVVCHEILNLPPDQLLNGALAAQVDTELNNFRLGGMLERIELEKLWTADGSKSFADWVLRNLGFRYSKARYLIGIHANLRDADIPWEKIGCLGWTRLRHLCGVLTPDNVDEWVLKAKDLTVLQLQDEIAKAKSGTASVESSPVTTLTFKVHEDQKESIKQAVDKAKSEAGTQFDAVALESICLGYLAGGTGKPTGLKSTMKKAGYVEVLQTFEVLWPEIDLTIAEMPASETASGSVEVTEDL